MSRLRLIAWALRSCRAARAQLARKGAHRVTLAPPPVVGDRFARIVERTLWHRHTTCLVRSVVMQQWLEANGQRVDVVVGVVSPEKGFRAHAWLDRDGATQPAEFTEFLRIPTIDGNS